ncbi:unnamed protein product, partial [Brachionus calyciflorus]
MILPQQNQDTPDTEIRSPSIQSNTESTISPLPAETFTQLELSTFPFQNNSTPIPSILNTNSSIELTQSNVIES